MPRKTDTEWLEEQRKTAIDDVNAVFKKMEDWFLHSRHEDRPRMPRTERSVYFQPAGFPEGFFVHYVKRVDGELDRGFCWRFSYKGQQSIKEDQFIQMLIGVGSFFYGDEDDDEIDDIAALVLAAKNFVTSMP